MSVIPERLLLTATGVTGDEHEELSVKDDPRSTSERLRDFAVGETVSDEMLACERQLAAQLAGEVDVQRRELSEMIMEQTSREIEEDLPSIRLYRSDNDKWDMSHRRFINVTGMAPADAANMVLRLQSREPDLEFIAFDVGPVLSNGTVRDDLVLVGDREVISHECPVITVG